MNELRELVRLAREGDAHAFAQLYEMIYQDLYRFAVYTLGHAQDAEDAVSEAVMDAFAGMSGLREPDAFKGWMFRILSNKCRRRLRQYTDRRRELPEEEGTSALDALAASQAQSAGALDEAERLDVRQAFEALPQEDRVILSLHLFAGYSSAEIGELLGINANTVRTRQSRALRRMGEILQ